MKKSLGLEDDAFGDGSEDDMVGNVSEENNTDNNAPVFLSEDINLPVV